MLVAAISFIVILEQCFTQDYYYHPYNITRSTLPGIAAYRSSLTLDWLAAEDTRQRELARAFEKEVSPARVISSDCIDYPRPSAGKIGRLMLELLKSLEGDEGVLISELIQILVRTKLLVDTAELELEPDLNSLVKTPGVMAGEPHSTFPKILAIIWILVTDPSSTRRYGWCPVKKMNQYIAMTKASETAKQMRAMDIVTARARFVIEEFIQSVTPINMYQKKPKPKPIPEDASTQKHAMKPRAHEKVSFPVVTESTTLNVPELVIDGIETQENTGYNNCGKFLNIIVLIFALFL